MSKVLLISFAGYPYSPSSLMPDNGLAALAGALIAAGHEPHVLDFGALQTVERLFPNDLAKRVRPYAEQLFLEGRKFSIIQKLRFLRMGAELDRRQTDGIASVAADIAAQTSRLRPDVVGFKLWNGDGFSGSILIARAIRSALPGVRIVAGGPQVDYFGEHILEYTDAFDMLMRGEGEQALPKLVTAIVEGQEWRDMPGLLWSDGASVRQNPARPIMNLDELPHPCYAPEVYPALTDGGKIRIAVLDESRGCPNRCAFCIHPIKSGGKWALKGPARVVHEMRRVMAALDTHFFIYSGSNTSARVAVSIAQEILNEGLDVRYGCFGHIRGIARADFDLLRRSGCEAIFYGLESGSPRILRDAFNKPLDLAEAERVLRQTREAGICAIASLIYPAPFEDAASRAETLDFLRRTKPDSVPVTVPGMIPGTPWETDPERYGFQKSRRKDLWEYALTYKIKLLYPPSLWKPLPYTLNGRSFRGLFRECEKFMAEVEQMGIVTNVPHELVLMALAAGRRDNLMLFRNECRAMFLSGDTSRIASMVALINANVRTSPAAAVAAQSPTLIPAAPAP